MRLSLLAAFLLAGTTLLAAPMHGAASTVMALPDCQFKLEVKPSSVLFACGDGGVYATSVHWNNWGASFATASATMHANDCEPNCAQGHFHVYAAYLAATGRQRCRNGEYAYAKISYVARTQGMPTPRTHLEWMDTPCH